MSIIPLLFVLAVELLALKIRQDPSIQGIKVVDTFTKIRQYADDTTFLLKDAIDFREVLSRLKEFSIFSGLNINKSKSKAICPGNQNIYGCSLLGIEMCEEIKLLGVYFSTVQATSTINKNWEARLIKTENLLRNWTRRDLTIIGKVLVLKTFAISNFVHLMQSIGMPENICHKLNSLFFKFLWKKNWSNNTKTFEKIKRKVMYNDLKYGGINMINPIDFQNGFYLQWVEKLLCNEKEEWKKIPIDNFKHIGGTSIFEGDIIFNDIKGLKLTYSSFWNKALEIWLSLKNNTIPTHMNSVIFNNMQFTYKKKPLWIPECISNNILRVKDVFINKRIMTFEEFRLKFPDIKNALMYHNLIRNAIYPHLLKLNENSNDYPEIHFRNSIIGEIGRKGFLKHLRRDNQTNNQGSYITPICTQTWYRKYGVLIDQSHWSLIHNLKETRLKALSWKILHNIYPTNILLFKMKITNTENCLNCREPDFTEHFFYSCRQVKPLWDEIEKQINVYLGLTVHLEEKVILLGAILIPNLNHSALLQINKAIAIGKLAISKFRYGPKRNLFEIYETDATTRKLWSNYL